MAKGGVLLYRCRLCQAVDGLTHVPDVLVAVSRIADDDTTPRAWGPTARRLDTHWCGDGRVGVSDLIGGREDS